MKKLQLNKKELKLVLIPWLMARVAQEDHAVSSLILSRRIDLLIPLIMMRFQMIISVSQTRIILIQ